MKILFFICTTALFAGGNHFEIALRAAENCSYELAIEHYSTLLQQLTDQKSDLLEEIEYRTAFCKYELGHFQEVVESFTPRDSAGKILLALSFTQLKEYERAISLLQALKEEGHLSAEGEWQLAYTYYRAGCFVDARLLFQKICEKEKGSRLELLANLYLAKVYLQLEQTNQALTILRNLRSTATLAGEVSFLLGETLYRLKRWLEAAENFEEALLDRTREWSGVAKQKLVDCYLSLVDEGEAQIYLERALEVVESLPKEELTTILTARCYLYKGRYLHDEEAEAKAVYLLKQPFSSFEAVVQSMLLQAQVAKEYAERDRILCNLTELTQHDRKMNALSWYYRGVHDQEWGKESAFHHFTRAAHLYTPIDAVLAGECVKRAVYCAPSESESIALLKKVFKSSPEIIEAALHPDEFYYLLARSLKEQTILIEQLKKYPKGEFADRALYLLAINHFKDRHFAKVYLEELSRHPSSTLIPEALYWRARCEEEGSPEQKELLKTIFVKYPSSKIAAEAYYSYYSQKEYLQALPEAISHLSSMQELFPDSPYTIYAQLLTGLNYKRGGKKRFTQENYFKAIEAFYAAETCFNRVFQTIAPEQLTLYTMARYRAIIERALANLTIATESKGAKRYIYLEYAVEMFQTLSAELKDPNHPFGSLVTQGESFSPILEETSYHLAICYIHLCDNNRALNTLEEMLVRYRRAKITKGYYLSHVFYQQGLIAIQSQQYYAALQFFEQSEQSAKGFVTTEERLELWLQRSSCYQKLGELNSAMLELSKVINEDAISSKRLEAMFLRAQIYELQGRFELAQKQLSALSQKGGLWALKAKEKLEREYL